MDAQRLVAAVIAGRRRWGVSYGTGEFTTDEILDALVELNEKGEIDAGASHEELVKAKRQLTASKAREAKAKKRIKALEQEVWDATEQLGNAREHVKQLQEQLTS